MDPFVPDYCKPSDPVDGEDRTEAIAEGIWAGLRDEDRAHDFASGLDSDELLGKVFKIIAKGQHHWQNRLWNGMKMTFHEHQASVYREIKELLDAEVEAIAQEEATGHPRRPVATNPATLLSQGKL